MTASVTAAIGAIAAIAMVFPAPTVAKSKSPHHRRTIVIVAKVATADAAGRPLTRAQILTSDPERLARIGRHIMTGYHSFPEVKDLVDRRAITGVFITDHNVKGRTPAAIKADIDALQAIRVAQGLSPLIIAPTRKAAPYPACRHP